MSGRGKKNKAQIQGSKPEPPPFLQKIREQIVASEGEERRARGEQDRLHRAKRRQAGDDDNDDPAIVKLNQDDLTEAEYKRMKKELETGYKLDEPKSSKSAADLDIKAIIQSRQTNDKPTSSKSSILTSRAAERDHRGRPERAKQCVSSRETHSSSKSPSQTTIKHSSNKKLSYGSSSSSGED